ncbi:hypothetical protein HR45_13275 [Shewanella mangrovi]|uniref:Universal stress protein B n=1 Tax=Shewanella mangrovi TaxID=1515746 RepID=A0A094JAS8_9GAMM|nr:hypothetical protein [Shewanella mangrovi]KFZ37010.1 hypothetical protein HR45_13275 [Shewanella mangrovi]
MNYVEAYIVLSGILIAGVLGLRNFRRQQLVGYVQHHYQHNFQILTDNTRTDDERFRAVFKAIAHGELSPANDERIQRFYQQLRWLNWLPIIILIAGFILASLLQP